MESSKVVILVNLGVFQNYINDNIENLLNYDNKVILIIDKNLIKYVKNKEKIKIIISKELDTSYFDRNSKHDRNFRQGFWKNASKRLFCVYEAMKKFNIKNCFHLENDVLIFGNVNELNVTNQKVHLVMDHEKRCIPSIVFIPEYNCLDDLIKNYNFKLDDMKNMAQFYNRNKFNIVTFPIINNNKNYPETSIYNEHFDTFKIIFDGAAIGQYLGGIDPRNEISKNMVFNKEAINEYLNTSGIKNNSSKSLGFINETTIIDYSKFKFLWKSVNNKKKLFIIIDEEEIPVFNIHVHCKNLKQFI